MTFPINQFSDVIKFFWKFWSDLWCIKVFETGSNVQPHDSILFLSQVLKFTQIFRVCGAQDRSLKNSLNGSDSGQSDISFYQIWPFIGLISLILYAYSFTTYKNACGLLSILFWMLIILIDKNNSHRTEYVSVLILEWKSSTDCV